MVLKRGDIIGYDAVRMMFAFTMRDCERVVRCEISSVALNDLARKKSLERRQQFAECRQQIESAACTIFENDTMVKRVRIFAKHFKTKRSTRDF